MGSGQSCRRICSPFTEGGRGDLGFIFPAVILSQSKDRPTSLPYPRRTVKIDCRNNLIDIAMVYKSTIAYNNLVKELQDMLMGDEQSIANQLIRMSDKHLVFQMINFSRGFENSSSKNAEIANFIDQSYACYQVTAIRGLGFDKRPESLSLNNTIVFLEKHIKHLTRKNYVCHGGLSYDFRKKEKKHRKGSIRKTLKRMKKGEASEMESLGSWYRTKLRHEQFDHLSNTAVIPQKFLVENLMTW